MESLESNKNGFFAGLSERTSLHIRFWLYKIALVKISDDCIEAGNHLCRIVDQLKI
jgi:hypothetical protein